MKWCVLVGLYCCDSSEGGALRTFLSNTGRTAMHCRYDTPSLNPLEQDPEELRRVEMMLGGFPQLVRKWRLLGCWEVPVRLGCHQPAEKKT